MDSTKKFEKLITDKKEIEGLPASALGLAAQTAVSKVLSFEWLTLVAHLSFEFDMLSAKCSS